MAWQRERERELRENFIYPLDLSARRRGGVKISLQN